MDYIKNLFSRPQPSPPQLGSFTPIPNELIIQITNYLPSSQDRLSLAHTCKTFKQLMEGDPQYQKFLRFCKIFSNDALVKEIEIPSESRIVHSSTTGELFIPDLQIGEKDIHYTTALLHKSPLRPPSSLRDYERGIK